jgi:hypothetical protein
MQLSSFDYLSPKITMYYNGQNSHISHLGGLLSIFFFSILVFLTINFLYDVFDRIDSLYVYEQNTYDKKFNQSIDYFGINHFLQIYSHSNKGWFGDFDRKNIIVYGIKEANNNKYNEKSQVDLYNTEHWLYDKCENIAQINKNLFPEISEIIVNYTKSICLRYYYSPLDQRYYEIGFQGYISPHLQTNSVGEKRFIYKIIFEKCVNHTIFTNKMQFFCNNETEIIHYLNIYSDIFIHFSNNQIMPNNRKYPFAKYFDSISSSIQKITYFENNLIFSPIKLITDKGFLNPKKEDLTYILKDHYHNDKLMDEEYTTIGIFNFYFRNNLIVIQRTYISFIECISHLGGVAEILFFIFQLINYMNNKYTILENSKNLFKINTGIDSNYTEGNELFFERMKHLNSQNYKIKVFNNNNIFNNEDMNKKIMKNVSGQNKKVKKNYEHHGFGTLLNKTSRKNLGLMLPINNINITHRKINNFDTKRSQTKYTNSFKQMGKQFTLKNIKNKRKSYMSQGLIKRKDYKDLKDYSNYSKNQSINENDINHEKISNCINENNNNSGFLLLRESKDKEQKEGFFKHDSKNIGEANIVRRNIKKKKTNLKRHNNEIMEPSTFSKPNLKKVDIKGRHKSVNFGNQRDFLFSSNLLGIKNSFFGKNSSEYINDSSKQIMVPGKSQIPLIFQNSKFQVEKNKLDDNISRPSILNNNDNNLNTVIYNNPNNETASFLKTIIQSKIKLIMPEIKQDYNLNSIMERKFTSFEFFKFFLCFKRKERKMDFLDNFRKKLLSEEHLYKVHINLYLLEKIFQIDETYKFNFNELYNNL